MTSKRITPHLKSHRRPLHSIHPKTQEVEKPEVTPLRSTSILSKTYHAVLYTKRSKKKHKSYLDGYAIIKDDRIVQLLNEDGKPLASERGKKLGGVKEGNTLDVGSWTLEIQNDVAEDDYISGRLFAKQQTLPPKSVTRKPRKAFKCPFSKDSQRGTAPGASREPAPMHDPTAKNAYVLQAAVEGCFGGMSVPVVLDPYLLKSLRPHQMEGVSFLYRCTVGDHHVGITDNQGAILADEMGLGKSLQAISLMWTLLKQSPTGSPAVKKAVIVCPASLVTNWMNEVKKWLGDERLQPVALESGRNAFDTHQGLASFVRGNVKRLLIVSYELFRANADNICKTEVGLLICDEGHRLKASQGNKTIESLKRLPCKRRVLLTGTPVQNDLEEFFAMCDFVNPGCLNSLKSFRTVFANPIITSRDANASSAAVRLGEARTAELSRITKRFVLRRTSCILAKYLPPKSETAIFCRLGEKQETAYEKEASGRFEEFSKFSAALSAINVLRKICSHPALVQQDDSEDDEEGYYQNALAGFDVLDSSKMSITLAICAQCFKVDDRVILVSNFTSTLDLIQTALEQRRIKFCRLDGSTPVNTRGDIVRRFNNGTLGDVFLLSAKAGGVGLNLIGANRLILFDPDWNPATDLQAMARVWRDGQKKPVFVYRLLCTGTIEEKIFQRQLFKGELQSAVDGEASTRNGKGKDLSGAGEGNFSAEQLRDLFQYNGNTEFCETLKVLERSQLEAQGDIEKLEDDFEDDSTEVGEREKCSTLLHKFDEYRRVSSSGHFAKDAVWCGEDEVLDSALNGDLKTHGLVSYLYTKKSDNESSAGFAKSAEEEPEEGRKRKLGMIFEDSDPDVEDSGDDEFDIAFARDAEERNKRRKKGDVKPEIVMCFDDDDITLGGFGDNENAPVKTPPKLNMPDSPEHDTARGEKAKTWDDVVDDLEEDMEDFI